MFTMLTLWICLSGLRMSEFVHLNILDMNHCLFVFELKSLIDYLIKILHSSLDSCTDLQFQCMKSLATSSTDEF